MNTLVYSDWPIKEPAQLGYAGHPHLNLDAPQKIQRQTLLASSAYRSPKIDIKRRNHAKMYINTIYVGCMGDNSDKTQSFALSGSNSVRAQGKRMKKTISIGLSIILVSGCAVRSSTKMAKGQERQEAHAEPICMLRSPLPSNIAYTVIGEVRGGKRTYGSVSEIIPAMADEARSIGADAIINLKTSQRMNAWVWARPIGSGTGVRLANRSDLDCLKMGGELH